MPRPTHPAGYPQVFSEIIERVTESAKTMAHSCSSPESAAKLRFDFYAFIRACVKSDDPKYHEIGEQGKGLIFRIEGCVMAISPRDHTETAYALEDSLKAFDKEDADVTVEPQDEEPPKLNLDLPEPKASHDDIIKEFLDG